MFWKSSKGTTSASQKRNSPGDAALLAVEDGSVLSCYKEGEDLSRNEYDVDDDDDDDEQQQPQQQLEEGSMNCEDPSGSSGCFMAIQFLSNLLFFFGSTLYIWTAYYVWEYYQLHQQFPREEAEEEQQQQQDQDQQEQQQYSLIQGDHDGHDDILFYANANRYNTSYVTYYMAYTFAAMVCFAMSGLVNLCVSHKKYNLVFVFAALWGMASSALVVVDTYLSQIFAMVSVHVFALQALLMVCFANRPNPMHKATTPMGRGRICTIPMLWLRIADFLFLLGTLADVVLSYFVLWKEQVVDEGPMNNVDLLYLAMAAAACWWICATIYLWGNVWAMSCGRRRRSRSLPDNVDNDLADTKSDQSKDVEQIDQDFEQNDDEEDDEEDEQESRYSYIHKNKYIVQKHASLKQRYTEETTDDEEGSVMSIWTEGPKTAEAIARSSLDSIFGRPNPRR
jgi:hypothetical protein